MMKRRVSLLAVACAAALAGCASEETTSSNVFFLTPAKRQLEKGGTTEIKIVGWTATGSVTTPAAGATVTLTATNATLSATTATLAADGSATVTLTLCDEDTAECTAAKNATVEASATIGGEAKTANAVIAIVGAGVCATDGNADCSNLACDEMVCDQGRGRCAAGRCRSGTTENTSYRLSVSLLRGEVALPNPRASEGGLPVEVAALLEDLTAKTGAAGKTITVTVEGEIGVVSSSRTEPGTASTATATTTTTGRASVWFHPGAAGSGALIVTAEGLTTRLSFDVVSPGLLAFTPNETEFVRIMGLKGSGFREQNILRFKLLDSEGRPFSGSARVRFRFVDRNADGRSLGGAALFPTETDIDANAEATVTVTSGVSVGTLLVHAEASIGTTTLSTVSDSIAIVGAKANGRNIAVNCSVRSIPALMANDCGFLRVDVPTECTAVIGDRYNNWLGRSVKVFWSTEGGLIGPPSSTGLANPDREPGDQSALGVTTNILRTLNTVAPKDVEPLQGEARRVGGPSECPSLSGGARTFNPRDGLNTIIVHTQGEEGFFDANNNGEYDAGEEFIDIGEPYVDEDDDNQHDADEEFVDANGNNTWDGPNGTWDADTTIWATGHVVFTNHATAVEWTPDPLPDVAYEAQSSFRFDVRWMDENLNPPAPLFSKYAVTVAGDSAGSSFTVLGALKPADAFGFDVRQVRTCTAANVCTIRTQLSGLANRGHAVTVLPGKMTSGFEEETFTMMAIGATGLAPDHAGGEAAVSVLDYRAVTYLAVVAD